MGLDSHPTLEVGACSSLLNSCPFRLYCLVLHRDLQLTTKGIAFCEHRLPVWISSQARFHSNKNPTLIQALFLNQTYQYVRDHGLIWSPVYSEKMESQSVVPNTTLTLPLPVPKLSNRHIPLFVTYHKPNITLSYSIRGKHLN